jgi:hypothetical protein
MGRLNLRRTLKGVTQFFPNSLHRLKMRNIVMHIPTKSGSDKVQSLIVVLVFHQLRSDCILKHRGENVCFMYDLLNGMTLSQEIIVSLTFLIIEILTIEDNELHGIFLHVAFGSKSWLRTTCDLTHSDIKAGDHRGVDGSRIKFFCKN